MIRISKEELFARANSNKDYKAYMAYYNYCELMKFQNKERSIVIHFDEINNKYMVGIQHKIAGVLI